MMIMVINDRGAGAKEKEKYLRFGCKEGPPAADFATAIGKTTVHKIFYGFNLHEPAEATKVLMISKCLNCGVKRR